MAVIGWRSDHLVTEIRDRAQSPAGTPSGWTDADLVRRAAAEVAMFVVPEVVARKEEHLRTFTDTTMTVSDGTYDLPTRAVLNGLREVGVVDTAGAYRQLLPLVKRDGLKLTDEGTPTHYYLEGVTLNLYPEPSVAETLRMHYIRRPNGLVAYTTGTSGNVGVISSIASNVVTLTTSRPTAWTTSTPLDCISQYPPFKSLGDDKTPTAVGGSTVTFAAGVTSNLAAGDFICLAGEAPVIQLPIEFFHLVAVRVACTLVAAWDQASAAPCFAERDRIEAMLFPKLSPRDKGAVHAGRTNSFFS